MAAEELERVLTFDGELITDAFDRWARRMPDHVFLHRGEDGADLSYGAASALTDHIAGNLARHGLGRGDRVAVFAGDPYLSVLWMFGIWKAGAVYCPVNTLYTGDMLAYQLADTKPRLVLTDPTLLPELAKVLPDAAPEAVLVVDGPNTEPGCLAAESFLAPAPRPDLVLTWEDLANIIYTSGTTGPSKGVVQTHRWINHYTFFMRQIITPDDVIYCDLPMYHIGGALALVGRGAWAGATIAIWRKFSSHEFWSRVRSVRATVAILVDVMTTWLDNAPPDPSDTDNTLSLITTQPVPANHQAFCRRFGIDYLFVAFGQTEAGCPVLALVEESDPPDRPEPGAIDRHGLVRDVCGRYGLRLLCGEELVSGGLLGEANPFLEAAVVDERGVECPPGQGGELALRPRTALPGMMVREYLDKPAATAHGFRDCWWHTGDAVRVGEDGLLYFVDRIGDRIRVRGENISSAHIEDILRHHEAVETCAAFAVRGQEGFEDDVVVVVQRARGHDLTASALSLWAESRLPKFMRPRHVFFREEIPRTPTNKIEKYKLKAEAAAAIEAGRTTLEDVAPR
jgi:crotonobetaine/carnitine-CoA ligase